MVKGGEGAHTAIEALLDRARSGCGGALVVVGEPGSGRTTLVEDAAHSASDLQVVTLAPVTGESTLPLACLHDLALAVGHEGWLAEVTGSTATERMSVARSALALVRIAANRHPMVLLVDDAHLADRPSLDALAFCARRLSGLAVACVFTWCNPPGQVTDPLPGVRTVRLDGLEQSEVAEVLHMVAGTEITSSLAAAVHEVTAGNSAAVAELAERLRPALRVDLQPNTRPTAGPEAHRRFSTWIRTAEPAVRRALEVAVVGEGDDTVTLRRALDELGTGSAALDQAARGGLIELTAGGARVVHPLVQSAVEANLAPEQVRELHATLAVCSVEPRRRAWHRAGAVVGPDRKLARAVDELAHDLDLEGHRRSAARAWQRAAELSEDPAEASARLYAAGQSWHLHGEFDGAEAAFSRALRNADPALRADIQHRRGHMLLWQGRGREAVDLLTDEARRIGKNSPAQAAALLLQSLVATLHAGRLRDALDGAVLCHEMGARVGAPLSTCTGALLGYTRVLTGDAVGEAGVLAASAVLDELEPFLDVLPMALAMTSFIGQMLTTVEAHDEADAILARTIAAARARSSPSLLAMPLAHHSEVTRLRGELADSRASALECIAVADGLGEPTQIAVGKYSLGAVEVLAGERDAATAVLREAAEVARAQGVRTLAAQIDTQLGLLALGTGEPEAALEAHERLRWTTAEVGHPFWRSFAGDHVEALVLLGERGPAAEALESHAAVSAPMRNRIPHAVVERCRGLLGQDDPCEHFERSLQLLAGVRAPLEVARTELCLGAHLRRKGHRTEARRHLRRARSGFDAMGASDWEARAESELRAAGVRSTDSGGRRSALANLTPQEARIVELVASTRTNREIADAMMLSPKTIENHLGRIYAKLGVRRRMDLIRLVAAPSPD